MKRKYELSVEDIAEAIVHWLRDAHKADVRLQDVTLRATKRLDAFDRDMGGFDITATAEESG